MTASDPPANAVAEAPRESGPPAPAGRADHSPLQTLKNIVTSYGALLVSSLSNIILTPIMLATLGTVDFGILRVSNSLLGYVGLLDLGVSTSIIYFVARYHSTGEREALDRYVDTVFNAISLLSVAVIAVCVVAAPDLALFLGVPPGSEETGAAVIRLSAFLFAAHLLGGVFGGILVGRGRYDVNNLITVGYLLANAGGTYVLLRLGYGLLPVVFLNTVTAVLGAAGRAVAAGALGLARVAVGRLSGAVLRASVGYGFWSFLNNVASQFSFATTDMIILARVLGVSSVSIYAVALAPVALISQFVFQFVDVFQPMITNLAYRQDGRSGEARGVTDVGPSFLLLMKTAVLLGWGPTLLLWLAGRQILIFWVGDVGAQAGDLLMALTFAFGWNFIGHAAGLILLSTARHQLLGVMAIVGSTLNVLLSLLFTMQFGLLGVALGTFIVMGVTEMIILPVYTCRLVGLPVRTYAGLVLRTALGLLVAYAVGTGAGLATASLLGEWGATAVACLSGGLIFLGACWQVLLTAEEREMLWGVVLGLLRRG